MPLTLFAQETGAAAADARRIDHPQAPVGFSAPLVRNKRLPGRTAQCTIWLGSPRLDQRSDLVSRAGLALLVHTLASEKASRQPALASQGVQGQTRSYEQGQDEADGPIPGASFHTHCETICQHSWPQAA
jgi:hypothetical protein